LRYRRSDKAVLLTACTAGGAELMANVTDRTILRPGQQRIRVPG